MSAKRFLTDSQVAAITNALRVAADKFVEDQKVFQDAADAGGSDFITVEAAERLADQFNRQIADCGVIGALLEAGVVSVEGEPEDFAEADEIADDCMIAAGLKK